MNYIYDIVLNFNSEYFDFFEWDKNDAIINIKKIPFFLIDSKSLFDFKYNKVTVDMSFINLISDKTLLYSKNKINNCCLLTNTKEVIGVIFDDRGNLIKRSSLLIDEEEEVINEADNVKKYDIPILKKGKKKIRTMNRSRQDKINYLINYINNEKNKIYLKYLYYDYFEEENNNILSIKKKLIYEINNNWNKKLDKVYETVKMFSEINN